MSEVFYVGAQADDDIEVEDKSGVETILNAGLSRDAAQARIDDAVALKASKVYVDGQDSTFATSSYHLTQNAALIPVEARGAANGVASLDAARKVPGQQIPFMGSGLIKGPYGANSLYAGATGTTPLKVAEWTATVYGVIGNPLVFMNISTQCSSDRTVIEIRIGNSTQTSYVSQKLIARGYGRGGYTDWQTISVIPATTILGETQDGVQDTYSASTSWLINAWMYNTGTGSSQTVTGQVSTACLFWMRNTL